VGAHADGGWEADAGGVKPGTGGLAATGWAGPPETPSKQGQASAVTGPDPLIGMPNEQVDALRHTPAPRTGSRLILA
jgi:hypothetical protein